MGDQIPHSRRVRRGLAVILWLLVAFTIGTFLMVIPMLVSGADREAIILVPRNATVENVTDSITKYMGESYGSRVARLMKVHKVDWSQRHGAYKINEGDSPFKTMRHISVGAQEPVRLTINGFRSLPTLSERISARLDFTPDSLLTLLKDSTFLAQYNLLPDQALALFLNDTYEVYWSSSPKSVLTKIGANYNKFWNDRRVSRAAELGLTPAQVMIIASIVDEETNAPEEKGRVGRLYINRLEKGMKLQADPTVRFAIGDFTIKRVRAEHLRYPSPYNTYLHGGLPPGPIRTTSGRTVDAILSSEPSEDLYMCAKEDFSGRHNFSSDYSEHQANARRYQEELNKRGIQ